MRPRCVVMERAGDNPREVEDGVRVLGDLQLGSGTFRTRDAWDVVDEAVWAGMCVMGAR